MLKLTALALLVLAAGKAKPPPRPEAPPDPCGPEKLKLGEVKKLIPFELPKDCKPRPPAVRVFVRAESEVATRLTCSVSGVDFKKHMLIVMTKSYVPGTVPEIWDERGKKVTVVGRQKAACPGDPKVEAAPVTVAFLMDTDPVPPEFGETTCVLPANCK